MGEPPSSTCIETTMSVSLSLGVHQLYRFRQILHRRLELCQKTDLESLFCFHDGWKTLKQNISICGSLLIASSLTDDGRLSTLLKCSAHLSKIASLSVRSVLPSALSSGVAQEIKCHTPFLVHHGTSSCTFCLQKTGFFLISCSARSLAYPLDCSGLSYKYCCRPSSWIQS